MNNYTVEPDYYNKCGIKVVDIIDAYDLDFNKANIIKYVLRSGKKSSETEIMDLRKAMTYCMLEIDRLEKRNNDTKQ